MAPAQWRPGTLSRSLFPSQISTTRQIEQRTAPRGVLILALQYPVLLSPSMSLQAMCKYVKRYIREALPYVEYRGKYAPPPVLGHNG